MSLDSICTGTLKVCFVTPGLTLLTSGGRTRCAEVFVGGVGRWRQSSLQDERHLAGDNGAHHPVERWTRAG